MRFMSWGLGSTLPVVLFLGLGTREGFSQEPPKPAEPTRSIADPIAEGKKIFERDWKARGPIHRNSDGLGPMFNQVSCAACHNQGSIGGGGPNANNVDLLSVVPPKGDTTPKQTALLRENAAKLHPGFKDASTIILHRYGPGADYDKWRADVFQKATLWAAARAKPIPKIGVLSLQATQRNTPALFGAGLIDAIPDHVLIEEADRQAKLGTGISGRVPQASSGAVGRFGWRGQTANLREFVLTACAVELGLEVPGHPQGHDPRHPQFQAAGLDLTAGECDSLVAYVGHLSSPERAQQPHLQLSLNAHKGSQLFESIGCADCHVRKLGDVDGIYSDLLLHDMGPGLADPVAAVPELTTATGGFSATYYGSSSLDLSVVKATTNVQQEWRTPPLWGVGSSPPYLHDGRANSLESAIGMHGGEANKVAQRYAGLSVADQRLIIQFLQSLVAPGVKAPPQGAFAGF